MDSQERIECLLDGKTVDRFGVNDFFWDETLKVWVSQGYPEVDRTDEFASYSYLEDEGGDKCPIDPAYHFGFDMNPGSAFQQWFDILPIRGYSEVIEETDEWTIKRDGAGAALKYWRHKSGTPEHIDFTMANRDIWEKKYRPHLLQVDRARFNIPALTREFKRARKLGQWMFYSYLFLWETLRQSLGDVCFYESLVLDPDWIHDFNRVYLDFFKMHFRIIFEEIGRPDALIPCDDLGYKQGLFCSPKTLETLFLPYYKEFVDFLHSYGVRACLHSCGGIEKALPLIVEAGFEALHPMEVKAGCDALKFAEKYGDKLMFMGGLDVRVLESGDRDLMKKEVVKIVGGMKSRGARYIFGSDHSIPPSVSYNDFQYALEVYREHSVY